MLQPLVTSDAFYGFVTSLMAVLLVLAVAVILVYEWDSLRRERT